MIMRFIRMLIPSLLLAAVAPAYAAGEDADDWVLFGRVLALVQPIVRAAAVSPDPQAAQREIDAIAEGRSPQANRLAAELVDEIVRDMPPEHRGTFIAIARDLLTLARREQARAAAHPGIASAEGAIQARKELHAMGLRYYDETQYREAVRRGDTIAIELYHAAGGIRNLPAAR
jgi:hypothetical protein